MAGQVSVISQLFEEVIKDLSKKQRSSSERVIFVHKISLLPVKIWDGLVDANESNATRKHTKLRIWLQKTAWRNEREAQKIIMKH